MSRETGMNDASHCFGEAIVLPCSWAREQNEGQKVGGNPDTFMRC